MCHPHLLCHWKRLTRRVKINRFPNPTTHVTIATTYVADRHHLVRELLTVLSPSVCLPACHQKALMVVPIVVVQLTILYLVTRALIAGGTELNVYYRFYK